MKTSEELNQLAVSTLDDMKAENVLSFDVRHLTSMTEFMVVASGRSDRHVRALADSVADAAKAAGERPTGMEGTEEAEWVLVDLNGCIVHVMQAKTRDYYQIEKLWGIEPGALSEMTDEQAEQQ